MFLVNPRSKQPLYEQLVEQLRRQIVLGGMKAGAAMPSVRQLATELGINPNTIQKAYHLLEQEGIIRSRTGAKSCVEVQPEQIAHIRMSLLEQDTVSWVRAMKQMGIDKAQAELLMERMWQDERTL